jgi:hypothetical protein
MAAAFALAALCFVLPAHAMSPMLQAWLAANTQCRDGPPDDPKAQQACKRRDQVGERLKRRGCVYEEDGDWWKCPHTKVLMSSLFVEFSAVPRLYTGAGFMGDFIEVARQDGAAPLNYD